jgi:hypothetical protein
MTSSWDNCAVGNAVGLGTAWGLRETQREWRVRVCDCHTTAIIRYMMAEHERGWLGLPTSSISFLGRMLAAC